LPRNKQHTPTTSNVPPSPPNALAEALVELQQLTERLRRDCPWDREQTAATIVPHTVEEAYEVADAALAGRTEKLVDELGDLLFQIFFLALTLQEQGAGSLEDVARTIHAKLVRRHPHVFGEAAADTAGEVKVRWEDLKREQEQREGVFHDVPESLPALMHARKVQRRAASVGFEYPDLGGALADFESELDELRTELDGRPEPAPETPPDERVAAELGDVLFALVNVTRRLNVDPELELRRASGRFVARVERAEELAAAAGETWTELELERQDRWYDLAKEEQG
jgi:MazG family protein